MGIARKYMKQMEHHMRPPGHHGKEHGCPVCEGGEHRECKKKVFMAMAFFGVMALANLFIVAMLHMMLHAKDTLQGP